MRLCSNVDSGYCGAASGVRGICALDRERNRRHPDNKKFSAGAYILAVMCVLAGLFFYGQQASKTPDPKPKPIEARTVVVIPPEHCVNFDHAALVCRACEFPVAIHHRPGNRADLADLFMCEKMAENTAVIISFSGSVDTEPPRPFFWVGLRLGAVEAR